jgi:hypothetical protein
MIRELDKTIDWEIEDKSVFSGDQIGLNKIEGYKAIIRDDNGEILSVMKKSYSPMNNSEFLEIVTKIQEISGFNLAGFNEFKGGRKVLGFLENNRENFSIGGNKIKDYFILGNSFDGTSSFFTGTTSVLIRCKNQFSQIIEHNKIRHTKKIKTKLDEYYAYLDFYFNQRDTLYKTFERIGNIKLTEELQEQMINFILGIKENSEKELSTRKQNQIELLRTTILTETKDLGENLWGAFNGVTKYTTHEIESRNPVFGNIFGIQGDINKRTLSFVKAHLALETILY